MVEKYENDLNGIEVYQDFVRHYETELMWKDTLEAKAVSFLGFIGIFIAVLLSVSALDFSYAPDTDPADTAVQILRVLAVPLALQVSAALILFYVMFGYMVSIGPSIADVYADRMRGPQLVRDSFIVAYGTTILNNRSRLSQRVVWFQLAVLLVAASLVQLVVSVPSVYLDVHINTWPILESLPLFLPAVLVFCIGAWLLVHDYFKLASKISEDSRLWEEAVKESMEDVQ